ncbi:MAG: DUF3298 and DUF4163 domain-containing protein [Bacteroidetes bacterium]|nr:DUF3298 and DUF4163 domain-containing protein [Bacteroidota bacterium]
MINRLLHLTILSIFSASAVLAQIDSNQMFYKRFDSDTDTLIRQANFIQLDEKLSGNYELSVTDLETKTIEVDGYIDEANQAVISKLGHNEPILQGVFFDDRFTGMWNPGKNGKEIELFESYPNGSIPLTIHYLRSEANLVDGDPDSPTAEIELIILYPDSSYNDKAIDFIKSVIQAHFIDTENKSSNPDSLLIQTEKSFYSLYKEQNKDWHDNGNSFDWMKETSMSVTYNSDYILCLEYLDYVYSGGAHGMANLSYDIFSLETGKVIEFQDIFSDDASDSLTDILTRQIRKDKQIPDSIALTRAGYFVDVIEPGKNIYLNGSGIGFVYNQYEIAPYSTGVTNIFLKYNQLNGLLKEDAPVQKIMQ